MKQHYTNRQILLMVGRVVAVITMIAAIFYSVVAIQLLGLGVSLFSSQQNVAEDQPHGIDVLGGFIAGTFGFIVLAVSLLVLALSFLLYIYCSKKLRASHKLSSVDKPPLIKPTRKN